MIWFEEKELSFVNEMREFTDRSVWIALLFGFIIFSEWDKSTTPRMSFWNFHLHQEKYGVENYIIFSNSIIVLCWENKIKYFVIWWYSSKFENFHFQYYPNIIIT